MGFRKPVLVLATLVVALAAAPVRAQDTSRPFPFGVIDYVALGDSYSAGEGVYPYTHPTDTNFNSCHRSASAYPSLVTTWLEKVQPDGSLGASDADVGLWHVACSGAVAPHLVQDAFNAEPPQLATPTLGMADLVTLTIGGNDMKFSAILNDCALNAPLASCQDAPASWVVGEASVDSAFAGLENRRTADVMPILFARLRQRLQDTYMRIRVAAPNAGIYVLGYPYLFPQSRAEQECTHLQQSVVKYVAGLPLTVLRESVADAEAVAFNVGEQEWIRGQQDKMTALTRELVEEAGFHFVDVREKFAGHEVCGRHGEWLIGVAPPGRSIQDRTPGDSRACLTGTNQLCIDLIGRGSFHPNARGQAAYAEALEEGILEQVRRGYPPQEATGLPLSPYQLVGAELAVGLPSSGPAADQVHCREGPVKHALFTGGEQCWKILRPDMDGDTARDWLLLSLDGESSQKRYSAALLLAASGQMSRIEGVPLGEYGAPLDSDVANAEILKLDGLPGDEIRVHSTSGGHLDQRALLTLSAGALTVVSREGGEPHVEDDGGALWFDTAWCSRNVAGDPRPERIEYQWSSAGPADEMGWPGVWTVRVWEWRGKSLSPYAVRSGVQSRGRIGKPWPALPLVHDGTRTVLDCSALPIPSTPLLPSARTPVDAVSGFLAGWQAHAAGSLPNPLAEAGTTPPQKLAGEAFSGHRHFYGTGVMQPAWAAANAIGRDPRGLAMGGCEEPYEPEDSAQYNDAQGPQALCTIVGADGRVEFWVYAAQRREPFWLVEVIVPACDTAGKECTQTLIWDEHLEPGLTNDLLDGPNVPSDDPGPPPLPPGE